MEKVSIKDAGLGDHAIRDNQLLTKYLQTLTRYDVRSPIRVAPCLSATLPDL